MRQSVIGVDISPSSSDFHCQSSFHQCSIVVSHSLREVRKARLASTKSEPRSLTGDLLGWTQNKVV
jgi:hypothetical protein